MYLNKAIYIHVFVNTHVHIYISFLNERKFYEHNINKNDCRNDNSVK